MKTSEIPQVLSPAIGVEFVRFRVKRKVRKGRNCRKFDACDMRRSVRIVRRRVRRITEGRVMFSYRSRSFLAVDVALVPGISIACGT